MKFTYLTIFPEIIQGYYNDSIMAKAVEKGIVDYNLVNIRDFATGKHKNCDDYPFGGGAGMVFKPEPLAQAIQSVKNDNARVVYMSPSGKAFKQSMARDLAKEQELIIICGRYEGIDQRIIDNYVDYEICIGDYVMSSGEIASLVLTDTVYRLVDGVIANESLDEESFSNGLLEYPHYTRPAEFEGLSVPDILLSGHHRNIAEWRRQMSLKKTLKNRPELLESAELTAKDKQFLHELSREEVGS